MCLPAPKNNLERSKFKLKIVHYLLDFQKNKLSGVQFHPGVAHTPAGVTILANFLFKIAKANRDWNLFKIKDQIIANLQKQIRDGKVVMAVSGGVDSLVAATLIKEAIGKKLYLFFIH